ncbi:hypothetical protein LguiA_027453 [Lonicera macranthoides]
MNLKQTHIYIYIHKHMNYFIIRFLGFYQGTKRSMSKQTVASDNELFSFFISALGNKEEEERRCLGALLSSSSSSSSSSWIASLLWDLSKKGFFLVRTLSFSFTSSPIHTSTTADIFTLSLYFYFYFFLPFNVLRH